MVTANSGQAQSSTLQFRLGVGGQWTPRDLESLLTTILTPIGWRVWVRSEPEGPTVHGNSQTAGQENSSVLEIVSLGNGLNLDSLCGETEELDAVVISPLAGSPLTQNEGQIKQMCCHLARFVRQLKPGGATIFAADEPSSAIFSSIRLDCQRLGYTVDDPGKAAFRFVRCDRPDPPERGMLTFQNHEGEADCPIEFESGEQLFKAVAALATVNLLSDIPVKQAILNLCTIFEDPKFSQSLTVH